jgi:excisionase family DNA binding protein
MASTSTERPMTTAEVADLFGVTVSAVVQWANAGKLPHFRTPGGQRRFHRAEIEALLTGASTDEQAS